MDNSTDITIIAYFNGSVIKNTEHGVIFIYDEPVYFLIPQTMSFEDLNVGDLNVGLCQGIYVSTQKKVVSIRYRCLISNFNNNIQYRPVKISNDRDMQIIFSEGESSMRRGVESCLLKTF